MKNWGGVGPLQRRRFLRYILTWLYVRCALQVLTNLFLGEGTSDSSDISINHTLCSGFLGNQMVGWVF